MTTTTTKRARASYKLPPDIDVIELIERAKQEFYVDPSVIGIGVGARRRADEIRHTETALIVYVKCKLAKSDVAGPHLIPDSFEGIKTDVVQPFSAAAPEEALGFAESHQESEDMAFIDWGRLHEQWLAEAGGTVDFHGKVQDVGDVSVIEDDGTLVKTINGRQVVDFVQAYKLFRTTHDDIYDFVTFFTDTPSGMPPQGGSSWYRFVYNDVEGIGLSPFDYRAPFGTNKMQGIMFLNRGHFPLWRYVMLQEQGHRWASFAPYKESSSGPTKTDHMLGGWGHWTLNFDDDVSSMDYDTFDWVESDGHFERISIPSESRGYCNLDLYLMGLLNRDEVGDFYLLSNLSQVSGNRYTATKKLLNVHNIELANGIRNPSAATAQKLFKNAFVVLTKDIDASHDYIVEVDQLRVRFEQDFREATKSLGRVDTTLGETQVELTPSQVGALTGGAMTALHRHSVRPWDLAVTGTQFTGSIQPGQTQRWFTYNWHPAYVANWSVLPTTTDGKVAWSVEAERSSNGRLTYWIVIRNVGTIPTAFEARYALMR
ncbi:MAG: hypothetical protein IIC72_12765 [Acidobacteria bacterium]|nr:hypothetical protein [Acidobacteriota bacterium]